MSAPHLVPYQGSKRKLASQILHFVQHDVTGSVFEPFAGSAAITLAAASSGIGSNYVIGDRYSPLIDLWDLIINDPEYLGDEYSKIWHEQLADPQSYFVKIRDTFNEDNDPVKFLYLVARCVKNSIRFNSQGHFNQSPDNRRLGMRPQKVSLQAKKISALLKGKTIARSGDFMEILSSAKENDLIYMDPPWQGTSQKKDPRYAFLLDLDSFIADLELLNERKIPYLLSLDGSCGSKKYGRELPSFLDLTRVELHAGRSSQATLLGRNDITIESLYLSPALLEKNKEERPQALQGQLFA